MLFDNLCDEFETAWDAIATAEPADRASGNFLFARQAMLLVELASWVASQDAATFRRFSIELQKREPLLFKRVPYTPGPGTRTKPKPKRHRRVPRIAPEDDPTSEVIEVIFDLLRHGLAHFGHQVYAPLKDGRALAVVPLGVHEGRTIDKVLRGGRTIEHLSPTRQSDGSLVMRVCTGTLYLDVRDASDAAGVWNLEADASTFTQSRRQEHTVEDLLAAFRDRAGPFMLVFESSPKRPTPTD